jgi:hypothetical protein
VTALLFNVDTMAGQSWLVVVAMLALGFLATAGAVGRWRRAQRPLLDLATMKIRSFAFVIGSGTLFRTAILAQPFLLPLFFQAALKMGAVQSGMLILAGMVGNLGMKLVTTATLRRFGLRGILTCNGLFLAMTFALCTMIDGNMPIFAIVAVLIASGMARSMQFTALNTLAFADVPASGMAPASTLFSTTLQLNAALGVAVGALSLKVSQYWTGQATNTVAAFHAAFWVAAALCALGSISAFALPFDVGRAVKPQKVQRS